ncbi:hypothetical protein bcgnr5416_53300 [Bacillus cereus]
MYKYKAMKWCLCLFIFTFLIIIGKTIWSSIDVAGVSSVSSNSETIVLNKTFKTTNWYVNTKLDNFFKVFKFVIDRTYITKCSMNSYVIKPVDIVM